MSRLTARRCASREAPLAAAVTHVDRWGILRATAQLLVWVVLQRCAEAEAVSVEVSAVAMAVCRTTAPQLATNAEGQTTTHVTVRRRP